MERNYTTSNTLRTKVKYRMIYHKMKRKGRIALFVVAILACALAWALEVVGLYNFIGETDNMIPFVVSIVAFLLFIASVSFSWFLSDAAYNHRRCGNVQQLIRSKMTPFQIYEEELGEKEEESPELLALDKKIGLGAKITAILEFVVAIIIAVVIVTIKL